MTKRSSTLFAALIAVALLASGVSMAVAKPKPQPKPKAIAVKAKAKAKTPAEQVAYNQVVNSSSLVKNLASLAGTSTAAVNALRSQGASLATVATSLGVDPAAVVAKTQSKLAAKLKYLVARGKFSQAKANRMLAKSLARLNKLMNIVPEVESPVSVPPTGTVTPPTVPATDTVTPPADTTSGTAGA